VAGRKAERRTFERVRASGAWVGAKGDLGSQDFLLESKSTTSGSYGLKLETLRKAALAAFPSFFRELLGVDGFSRSI
jgi:hypothetical protein